MNIRNICMHCMSDQLNEYGECAACGKTEKEIKATPWRMPLRTILKGKYLIGKVIGEGGFGITYIGYDLDLEICVAIKEFCPKKYVGRDVEDGLTLYLFDESKEEEFAAERDKYINEARRLAKFRNEGGVVSIMDYFIENGTAYIVMDYIDGITLKSYLKTMRDTTGRNMNMADALNLFKPVMETLAKIHKSGIIHRDISPENIMISKDFTKVYLIDFGTARDMESGHTLSQYSKGFYTPVEQMNNQKREKLKQGPWTDVYALCATIYLCITGRVLSDSVSRLIEEDIIMPSKFGVDISPITEAVLMKGLAVKPEDRVQSMEELMQAFYGENKTVKPAVKKEVSTVNVVAEKSKSIENNEAKDVNNIRTKELEQEKQICQLAVARLERHSNILSFFFIIIIVTLFVALCCGVGSYWLFFIAIFVMWIFYSQVKVLLTKKKSIFLASEPSVGRVLLQIEVMQKFWVAEPKNILTTFKERSMVNWSDYKEQYLKCRCQPKAGFNQFWDRNLFCITMFRYELVDYYHTIILPSNIPEELKVEWKQAAIDSWIIIEE